MKDQQESERTKMLACQLLSSCKLHFLQTPALSSVLEAIDFPALISTLPFSPSRQRITLEKRRVKRWAAIEGSCLHNPSGAADFSKHRY